MGGFQACLSDLRHGVLNFADLSLKTFCLKDAHTKHVHLQNSKNALTQQVTSPTDKEARQAIKILLP